MSIILNAVGLYDVVVNGAKPALEGADDELEAFNRFSNYSPLNSSYSETYTDYNW